MTETLSVIIGILWVAVAVLIVSRRWPNVALPLAVAFIVRLFAVLFHQYVSPLPGSDADAVTFERVAWEWSQQPFGFQFVDDHSYLISWILAIFYRLVGRSPFFGQTLSLFLGTGAVFLGWYLTQMMWGRRAARRAVWIMALFPTLILYSAIIMREAFIWFFAAIALIGVVLWAKERRASGVLIAMLGFGVAGSFHGGMLLGAIAFLGLILLDELKRASYALQRGRVALLSGALLIGGSVVMMPVFLGMVALPKIGDVTSINSELLISSSMSAARDGARYPDFVIGTTTTELVVKAPLRVAYFLFSPFPWDIRSPSHLIGLVDGLIYLFLAFMLFLNRESISVNKAAGWVFLIVLSVVIVFAFGVGNFGTAIRHRGKILIALIALVAPRLRAVVLRK